MSIEYRIIIGIILIAIIEYYFAKRVNNSANTVLKTRSKLIKYTTTGLIVWANIFPVVLLTLLIYSVSTKSNIRIPENIFFDYFVQYPFWILFIYFVQAILLFLAADILRLILYPLYKKFRSKLKPIYSWYAIIIAAFFLAYVPLRVMYDFHAVQINEVEYIKPDLPEALSGFKLVLISDIQADRYTDTDRLKNYIDKVNEIKPDLVLIAGDVITSTPDYINTSAQYIGMIDAKYGTFACVGDHDNWAYREDTKRSIREIQQALQLQNVEMINNGKEVISVDGGAEIRVTFITNTYVERIPDAVLDSLTNSNLNYDLLVFLTHQPRPYLMESARKYNYDMFLAGHTHGGQISFAFPFIRLSPTLFETYYVRGAFYQEDMLVYITRGLGMSLAPIRYNSTPEITLITLRPGK